MGNLLRNNGISLVVAAGDTHRAGAIEQLTQHAERLSLKVIAQRYGADPSAVGRDAVDYARKHYVDAVLIDTAGRMQTSKNLMDEMTKIVRVVKPDAKIFVGDSLAGNDTINQAREFFQYANFDGAILTKIDSDAKGGAAISIAHITARPVTYVGVGQGYDDMIPFDPDKFIQSLFGSATASVQDLMSAPLPPAPEPVAEEKPAERPAPAAAATPVASPLFQTKAIEPAPAMPKEDLEPEPPKPVQAPKPPSPPGQPEVMEEPKEEKKGRFGFFGRKKGDSPDERKEGKGEEKRKKEDEDRRKREEEERKRKEKEEKKNRKEDKDSKKDEVVYLTDEDIEDLLK
ncbi:MAG: signal recognition particle-docking protein FtsY, partial [Nitrososphaera sp.]|uniref:signal recognition particle-docking protein FtsY n=1 Tax=Nitrososphaera sp. TaxID=1971748 RepID=UPI003D6F04A7